MDAPGGSWTVTSVQTTVQMLEAVRKAIKDADALVMSAAPADERPVTKAARKIAKDGFGDSIAVEPNPDILATLAPMTATMTVMAFAAESAVSVDAAAAKMRRKGADLLFANPAGDGRGFGEVPDEGLLVRADGGESRQFPPMPKELLADLLIDELASAMERHR
jgi:phosphopantothenoylcysteine decarboxylase/phosphopantothenate--cysteine ligase